MDFTCELSKLYSVTPFEIMKQDKDEVIMIINYYIEKGKNEQPEAVVFDDNATEKQKAKTFWAML